MNSLAERGKFLIFIGIIFVVSFFSRFIFAYDETIVHPTLTGEAAKLYNLSYGDKLSEQEINWIKQGSIDEDKITGGIGKPVRSGNHFYNPLGVDGWVDGTNKAKILSIIGTGISSKNWAHGSVAQSYYVGGDYTWERAIYEYNNGNKRYAYEALGHILHLIEDKAVPAHVRSDLHISPKEFEAYKDTFVAQAFFDYEPYETWTGNQAKLGSLKFDFANSLFKENKKPIVLNNLDEYFNNVAGYTNNNFFSKDTIYAYLEPSNKLIEGSEKTADGKIIDYVYNLDENGKKFRLAKIIENINTKQKVYSVLDTTPEVHSDYWSRLAPKSIQAGAGIIKLFKDEVERAKENPQLAQKPDDYKSFYAIKPAKKAVNSANDGIMYVGTTVGGKINSAVDASYNASKFAYNSAKSTAISAYDSAKNTAVSTSKTLASTANNLYFQMTGALSSIKVDIFSGITPFVQEKKYLKFDMSQPLPEGAITLEEAIKNFQSYIIPTVQAESSTASNQNSYDAELILDDDQNLVFAPGQDIKLNLQIKNTGTEILKRDKVSLNIYMPQDQALQFYEPSWITQIRLANLENEEVLPGSIGNFNFSIKSPSDAGNYSFRLRPVRESDNGNFNWLGNDIASWTISIRELGNPGVDIDEVANDKPVVEETIDNGKEIAKMEEKSVSSSGKKGNTDTGENKKENNNGGGDKVIPPSSNNNKEGINEKDLLAKGLINNTDTSLGWSAAKTLQWRKKALANLSPTPSPSSEPEISSSPEASPPVSPEPTPLPDSTPTPTTDHLVISEVQVGGGKAEEEFIEIYNPTDNDVDLEAISLKLHIINSKGSDDKKNLDFSDSGMIIKPHGYYLIASKNYKGIVVPDATYSSSGNSLVADGAVYISTSTENKKDVIDLVGWGDQPEGGYEAEPFLAPGKNQSLERKTNENSTSDSLMPGSDKFLGNAWDSDDNSADFVLRDDPDPQNSSGPVEPRYAPEKITDLSASAIEGNSRALKLKWSAPYGAFGDSEDLNYDIRHSTAEITNDNFENAEKIVDLPQVKNAGEDQELEISNLSLDKTYYFAIKTKDNTGLESPTVVASYAFPSAQALSPWHTYKGNNARTGQSVYLGPQIGNLKWKYSTGFWVAGSPSIDADGNIYLWDFEDEDYNVEETLHYGHVAAISDDGKLSGWIFPIPNPFQSTPAIDPEGNIFVAGFTDSSNGFYKFYQNCSCTASTDVLRTFGSPLLSRDLIYAATSDGWIHAIGTSQWETRWKYFAGQTIQPDKDEAVKGAIWGAPSEDKDGNIYASAIVSLFSVKTDPENRQIFEHKRSFYRLFSLDQDGNLRWQKDLITEDSLPSSPEFFTPAVGESSGYVSAQNNIFAFDLSTGETKWIYSVGQENANNSYGGSPSLANNGVIYEVFSDGYLYAVDSGGNLKWKKQIAFDLSQYQTRYYLSSAAIGVDGTVYIGGENNFYALNPADGSEKWQYSVEDDFKGKKAYAGTPAIGKGGRVYVSFAINGFGDKDSAKLYAFWDD